MGCINQNNKPIKVLSPIELQYQTLIHKTTFHCDTSANSQSQRNCSNPIKEKYKVIKELGKGSFGCVYLVEHLTLKILRAMKIMKVDNCSPNNDNKSKFIQKIEMLMALDHPNILKVYEYYCDNENYYIISEYINGGELKNSLSKKGYLSEEQTKYIMKQLLSAVNYLHSKSIIHRDIKLENILIETELGKRKGSSSNSDENNDDENNGNFNIKLIDFDSYCKINPKGYHTNRVGSPLYLAPEVLMKHYNEKCDIWSAGVLCYYLLIGSPPFSADTAEDLFAKILSGNYSVYSPNWSYMSFEGKDLLSQMLTIDFNQRLSALACLKHPWFRGNSQSKSRETTVIKALNCILNYKDCNQFKKIALAYIIYSLNSNNQFLQMSNAFQDLDNDSDGLVSYEDVITAYKRNFGYNLDNNSDLNTGESNQINRIIEVLSSVDTDEDHKITYEEFLFVSVDREILITRENLKLAFDYFDTDNNGIVTKPDLFSLFRNNKKQIDYWFDNMNLHENNNTNNNESLTYEDFIEVMER